MKKLEMTEEEFNALFELVDNKIKRSEKNDEKICCTKR